MNTSSRRMHPLAWVFAAVAVVVVSGLVGWIAFLRTVERVPAALAAEGRETVHELAELAAAFQQETVTERFFAYSSSVRGTSRLQVATLQQVEVFELRDEATVFWGALDLPPVEVRATAPVTTTYFVDLDGEWHFELEGRHLAVEAPALRFNKPAVDASRIEYEVEEGSLLRDEAVVLEQLKRELTGRSAMLARRNVDLVRDTARLRVGELVEVWLLRAFADGGEYDVRVRFGDEPEVVGEAAGAGLEEVLGRQ